MFSAHGGIDNDFFAGHDVDWHCDSLLLHTPTGVAYGKGYRYQVVTSLFKNPFGRETVRSVSVAEIPCYLGDVFVYYHRSEMQRVSCAEQAVGVVELGGKNELMREVKLKADAYTEVKARLISAKQETEASLERHKEAGERLAKGLLANDFENEDAARAVLIDPDEIERIRNRIAKYYAEVKAADDNLNLLIKELDGRSEPDEEKCNRIVNEVNGIRTEYTEKKAILENNIERLENKYKNLISEGEGIEEKIHQTENDYVFAKKLRGDTGTGIQRYVLGVMFSSVVVAANKMLEHVHGGRYRLYRTDDKAQGSNKRGLELKVYDKHSEDGNGRFVSTLSGGEKFLASLALSIGMSTVAQKSGIKINALFIDEGFGSLDEDSISDAMNILNSIQEANGLVGIISHVQLLQERIPTKLKVIEVEKGSHIVKTIG